ncbi:MAG TPA: hypothetical protein VM528_06765 [Burkholderiaceae bacterium]|nr:hypothetical protein [Burkholderiaceae bacterium]
MPAAPAVQAACVDLLWTYQAPLARSETSLDLAAPGSGRLTYRGAYPSRDPRHPQFTSLLDDWRAAAPTLAFHEGADRPPGESAGEAIRAAGEAGLVRHAAQRDGVRVVRLEPAPQVEVDLLVREFGAERVKLFYVLRDVARARDRDGLDEARLKIATARWLELVGQRFPQFAGSLTTVAELDATYTRLWPGLGPWWTVPAEWFDPLRNATASGGLFTNDVQRLSSRFRDRYMFEQLVGAVRRGERVFAVVGREHVAAQAAALRCEFPG